LPGPQGIEGKIGEQGNQGIKGETGKIGPPGRDLSDSTRQFKLNSDFHSSEI
jgi:hypothetical protein